MKTERIVSLILIFTFTLTTFYYQNELHKERTKQVEKPLEAVKEKEIAPVIGKEYMLLEPFNNPADPFAKRIPVKVLNVKDGFVLFSEVYLGRTIEHSYNISHFNEYSK